MQTHVIGKFFEYPNRQRSAARNLRDGGDSKSPAVPVETFRELASLSLRARSWTLASLGR